MKHTTFPQDQTQKTAGAARSDATNEFSKSEIGFTPSPGELAGEAYFFGRNGGSRQGHEVQYWLAAEAALMTEPKFNREHDFLNQM